MSDSLLSTKFKVISNVSNDIHKTNKTRPKGLLSLIIQHVIDENFIKQIKGMRKLIIIKHKTAKKRAVC